MQKIYYSIAILIIFAFSANGQKNGTITGKMVDASNGEPLFFANVSLEGTSLGAVTNDEGVFKMTSVPPGDYTLVLLYVGYEKKAIPVTVKAGETLDVGTHEMIFESVMGEEVVVTGQLRGQAAAINQQVKSNTIVNVVSKERIQEVPDVNAAESLSRLPGITISRSGGEGSKITVRGVSPRFNNITVNGQSIAATGAGDRSVDLSMVSSDILDGIEVYKAITPNMDADAVGGSVNLVTKTADSGVHGRVQLETGYHGLIKDIGTYRGSFTLGNRFFDDKLGIIIGANAHRANRNSDFFDVDYFLAGTGSDLEPVLSDFETNNLRLRNNLETRDRYGANITLDYEFINNSSLVFDYFYTQTDREIIERQTRMRPTTSSISHSFNYRDNFLTLHSAQLRGDFNLFETWGLKFALARSYTSNETPTSYGTSAGQEAGFASDMPSNAPPEDVPNYAKFTLENVTGGSGLGWSTAGITDENYTAQINLSKPFALSTWFSGDIKFGGKIKQKDRQRTGSNYGVFDGVDYFEVFRSYYPDFALAGGRGTYWLRNFIDPEFTGYVFPMGEQYILPYAFDPNIIAQRYEDLHVIDSLWYKQFYGEFNRYDAIERVTAGYFMTEVNIGNRLVFIPGFRYENTFNEYTGKVGRVRGNTRQFDLSDSTGTSVRDNFLPMFHLKYEFVNGLNLRLAATKTLTRPDFLNLAPFTRIKQGFFPELHRGSLELEIPTAWNYDAILTWFSKYGLVSFGGFYKEIENIDIDITYTDYNLANSEQFTQPPKVTNPINSERTTTVYGAEFELQTNLRFLPKPLDGIVISGNYSLIRSETYYPYFLEQRLPPDWKVTVIDTFRTNSMPGQADYIANITLGYEKGGFSGRVSMNLQGAKLVSSGDTKFEDEYTAEYLRWDATLSQKFGKRWMVLLNLINFTNTPEQEYMYYPERPTHEEYYGWQTNLGVRYSF